MNRPLSPRPHRTSKLRGALKGAVLLGSVLPTQNLWADQCLPVVDPALVVNGVVVGHSAGGMTPPACAADAGWGGVVGYKFDYFPAGGQPQGVLDGQPSLFIAADNTDGNASLNKLYVGVHVESDPNLREGDKMILLFDADGDGTFDDGDFALGYDLGIAASPITELCSQAPGQARYYTHSSGAWSAAGAAPAAIVSQIAWDFDPIVDPETGIWELEVAIDLVSLGKTVSAVGGKIGFGAKLLEEFQFDGLTSSTVKWKFPNALTASATNTWEPANTFDDFTAANLELFKSDTACGFDVIFESSPGISSVAAPAGGGSEASRSNKFHQLDNTEFNADGTTKTESKNRFNARIKLVNTSDPTDMRALAVPDAGKVKFWIKPWNGDFLGEYQINDLVASFTHVGEVQSLDFAWPETKAQYTPVASDLSASEHSCLQAQIHGFPVNQVTGNDMAYRNLTYTATSFVQDTFLVSRIKKENSTHGGAGPEEPDTVEYLLRANWRNLIPDMIDPADTLKWSYTFPNAAAIGLTDLGGDLYSLFLGRGETKKIAIRIHGGKMPSPPIQLQVKPDAGGTLLDPASGADPLVIPVKAGQIVTLIAHGNVTLHPNEKLGLYQIGPNGIPYREFFNSKMLMPREVYTPSQNVGALLVSFDKFETAFASGSDKTFIVPEGAVEMFLGVNDIAGGYGDNSGPGFEVYALISDPVQNPTTLSSQGNAAMGQPNLPRAGVNMPGLEVNAYRVGKDIADPKARDLRPASYVAWAVYFSHADSDKPDSTGSTGGSQCGWPKGGSSKAGIYWPVVLSLVGLGALRFRLRRRSSRKAGG